MIDKLIFNGNLLNLNEKDYAKNLAYANDLHESYLTAVKNDPRPRIGDIILRKNGEIERFTVVHRDLVVQCGSSLTHYGYHLGENGYSSYSGTCGELLKEGQYEITSEFMTARYWFFNVCTTEKAGKESISICQPEFGGSYEFKIKR